MAGARLGGTALVVAMCLAMAASLLGFSTFAAVTPTLIGEWGLSKTEAGWLNGIFFAGYMVAVPFLVGGTDRIDARTIVLVGGILSALSLAGLAMATGFWSAMAFRILGGVGFAGCYMPGLKALIDRYESRHPSRAVSFYTASYAIGAGASFWLSGAVAAEFGWRWAFGVTLAGPLAAFAIAAWVLLPDGTSSRLADWFRIPDVRPVFSNRPAIGYIVAYTLHTGELFVFLSWVVAFLTFAAALHPVGAAGWDIPLISAVVTVVALPSSIVGNEIAIRFGRRRMILTVMMITALVAASTGFSAALSFPAAAAMCLVYGTIIATDSSALTAGTVGAARPDQRGATMALHSFLGFGAGAVGPLILGVTLDVTGGGETVASWGIAFTVIAVLTMIGPPVLLRLVGKEGAEAVSPERL
ncbi:MAG: MFS transporter [Alphaproteobacteria bacterium]|nr:MFS transporter [Alphaproteobacteria bacterium]